ncbi:MAG: SMP-30/gluconolactonase/LRE family protein [Tropicimonas sp.]|uniref:SMP-30/gluconolactonase/LRE family protein n=1 Tax=Tropicimonas sp. TaxID=2067044 RepID=UPI003A841004
MTDISPTPTRRSVLMGGAATALASALPAGASGWDPSLRYPDPAIEILDESFLKYRIFNASVERLATGYRWAEGPVWIGDGRCVLFSDIPNNQMIRWDEVTGQASVFRAPAGYSNGNARDREGRLLTCEGGMRRVTRTEFSGEVTIIADSFEGKPFNSPNDLVCTSDGAIWFTDPPFQISNDYEGHKAEPELPHSLYRISPDGVLQQVLDDIAGPNGLCFSADEATLYIVEGRAQPNRLVWAFSVGADGALSEKRVQVEALNHGALDGIKCDVDGNLWCGWGSSGVPEGDPEALDGVMVFNPEGKPIGHIRLPERCANLCFGGAKGNRLFMTACHSLYSLYVNTRGTGLL